MNQLQYLQKKSIDFAKTGDWESAAKTNQDIIEQSPQDVGALNRLGFCYIQLNKKEEAMSTYQKVLTIEKVNPIAKKYLDLLKQNIKVRRQQTNVYEDFVEEPRKTKIVSLDRLAGSKVLSKLSVAMLCTLKTKGRYVCVQTEDEEYIGSLPEDISFHLSQLIKTGNEYLCLIRSVSKQECVVFIKEKFVSDENKHTPSFFVHSKFSQIDQDEDVILPDLMDQEVGLERGEKEAESEEDGDEEIMNEQLPSDILGKVSED
ncbi:MAG: tetratricopeptide repeat protein [Patescibacteria group bacterium]